ncbi:hypothetical protein ACWC24_34620, partial [Streptomyces sp. NPDC001443]
MDDHVIVEAQVHDCGFSPAQQDEIWRRWREGQSFSLIGRALGAPVQSARRFLHQSGGVRITPQQRSERHLRGLSNERCNWGCWSYCRAAERRPSKVMSKALS